MNIRIELAKESQIDNLVQCLHFSDLERVYFNDVGKTKNMLLKGIEKQEIYIAIYNDKCLGFLWYMPRGAFGNYPYLHLIAVKQEYRSNGIGSKLLNFFEENASTYTITKDFLTVDDFNPRAKKLYESLGYRRIATLQDFYQKGIDSYLMMKVIDRRTAN